MERAQNLEVGGVYYWKQGRNDYVKVQLKELPDPNLPPPRNNHVTVKVFNAGDPDDQAMGNEGRTHKTNLYVKLDEDMAGGKKRRTRRRRTHKKRKTLSRRK